MSGQPAAPAEALLIQQRREAATSPISRRQAAAKAGISPSQWSDIERGQKRAGQGTVIPVRATAETLARMARTIGIAPDELAAAGRQDAADILLASEQRQSLGRRLSRVPGIGQIGWPERTTEINELLPAIAAALDQIETSELPAPAKRDLTSMLVSNLTHDVARRHHELRLLLRLATSHTRATYPATTHQPTQPEPPRR